MATATQDPRIAAVKTLQGKSKDQTGKAQAYYQSIIDNINAPEHAKAIARYVAKVAKFNKSATTKAPKKSKAKKQRKAPAPTKAQVTKAGQVAKFEARMAKAGKKKVAIKASATGTGIMSLPHAVEAIAWYAKNYSTAKKKHFNRLAQSGKKRPAQVVAFYRAYTSMQDRTGDNNLFKVVDKA